MKKKTKKKQTKKPNVIEHTGKLGSSQRMELGCRN